MEPKARLASAVQWFEVHPTSALVTENVGESLRPELRKPVALTFDCATPFRTEKRPSFATPLRRCGNRRLRNDYSSKSWKFLMIGAASTGTWPASTGVPVPLRLRPRYTPRTACRRVFRFAQTRAGKAL